MAIIWTVLDWIFKTTAGRWTAGLALFFAWLFLIHDPQVRDKARSGYVSLVEQEKLKAERDELQRQNTAIMQANNDFNKKLVMVQAAEKAAAEQLATENARHEAEQDQKPGGNKYRITDPAYLEWLLK